MKIPVRKEDNGPRAFITQAELDAYQAIQKAVENMENARQQHALCQRILDEKMREYEAIK